MLEFLKGFFGSSKEIDSELAGNVASAAKTLDIDMAMEKPDWATFRVSPP